jgi:hypothetical protein
MILYNKTLEMFNILLYFLLCELILILLLLIIHIWYITWQILLIIGLKIYDYVICTELNMYFKKQSKGSFTILAKL